MFPSFWHYRQSSTYLTKVLLLLHSKFFFHLFVAADNPDPSPFSQKDSQQTLSLADKLLFTFYSLSANKRLQVVLEQNSKQRMGSV